jgi:hypothetical protein
MDRPFLAQQSFVKVKVWKIHIDKTSHVSSKILLHAADWINSLVPGDDSLAEADVHQVQI